MARSKVWYVSCSSSLLPVHLVSFVISAYIPTQAREAIWRGSDADLSGFFFLIFFNEPYGEVPTPTCQVYD
jgi:hypothetical protein